MRPSRRCRVPTSIVVTRCVCRGVAVREGCRGRGSRCSQVSAERSHRQLRRGASLPVLPPARPVGNRRTPARLAGRGARPVLRAGGPDGVGTGPRDFLAAATPGAGKTTFALRLASELMRRRRRRPHRRGRPDRAPEDAVGGCRGPRLIRLDPALHATAIAAPARQYHGVAVTYAQVAVKSSVHQRLTEDARTLVILDEVHHGGDALSWGDALRDAYGRATRRLLLSGTPFRSDTAPIPFVEYHPDENGIRLSRTDYNYGYGRALADGVVRPVHVPRVRRPDALAHAARVTRWRPSSGRTTRRTSPSQAWRTALDPEGEWIPAVLRSADRRLTEVREQVPDAGGLVIATDQTAARAYATILREHHRRGSRRSSSPTKRRRRRGSRSSARARAAGWSRCAWCRRAWTCRDSRSACTRRRRRHRCSSPRRSAASCVPAGAARRRASSCPHVPQLLALAGEMERQRDHALDRDSSGDDEWALDEDADGCARSARNRPPTR